MPEDLSILSNECKKQSGLDAEPHQPQGPPHYPSALPRRQRDEPGDNAWPWVGPSGRDNECRHGAQDDVPRHRLPAHGFRVQLPETMAIRPASASEIAVEGHDKNQQEREGTDRAVDCCGNRNQGNSHAEFSQRQQRAERRGERRRYAEGDECLAGARAVCQLSDASQAEEATEEQTGN